MSSKTIDMFAESIRRHVARLAKKGAEDAHSLAHRPLSEGQIAAAEERLGFEIPSALATLYAEVGNGGFGPAYGLLGLVGGARQEEGWDAVTVYERFRQAADDPHWKWPEKLLPVVHLGCGMFFCVDCSDDTGPVVWWEPNAHGLGSWDDAFFPLRRTFRDLMTGWTNGEDALETFQSALGESE